MQRPEYAAILARLRRTRRRAGLTEADVEAALGLPAGQVAKWEAGKRRLDALEFADLAELYGKPMTHFFKLGRRKR